MIDHASLQKGDGQIIERRRYCDYLRKSGKITRKSESVICDNGYNPTEVARAMELYAAADYQGLNVVAKGMQQDPNAKHVFHDYKIGRS